jgi:hypothetical protein
MEKQHHQDCNRAQPVYICAITISIIVQTSGGRGNFIIGDDDNYPDIGLDDIVAMLQMALTFVCWPALYLPA